MCATNREINYMGYINTYVYLGQYTQNIAATHLLQKVIRKNGKLGK